MGAAIDDVHHRHGQNPGANPADIFVERQSGAIGRGLGGGEADPQDGVGAEAGLVGRAVKIDQGGVQPALVFGVEAAQSVVDLAVHRIHSLADALAAIAGLVPVPLLHRLVCACGGPGGHGGAA